MLKEMWTKKLVAGAALAVLMPLAHAGPITFETNGGSVDESGISIGVEVETEVNPGLVGYLFDLEVGETSEKFDFFDVTASGLGLVAGVIEASLHFLQPDEVSATGHFFGAGGIFGFTATGGLAVLSQPDAISFGDNGLFAVNFYGFVDGCKSYLFGCTSLSGTVQADVTLLRSSVSVPEPGTIGLLGAGLLGLGLVRRRFNRR